MEPTTVVLFLTVCMGSAGAFIGHQFDKVRKDIRGISGSLSVTYAKLETIQQEIAELKAMIK